MISSRMIVLDKQPGLTGQRGRYLEIDDGDVPTSSDGAVGEGRLRDSPTCWGSGSVGRGRHTCNARPLVGTLSGGGLGVSPH